MDLIVPFLSCPLASDEISEIHGTRVVNEAHAF